MNFTREPIIETIITPKEGHKLIVRNSSGSGQEEYSVEALEVVSFGHSFFFRSSERPKAFLVPVSDYEVIETKETRVVLKTASFEKAIKIGGGRDAAPKVKEKVAEAEVQEVAEPAAVEQRLDKKRERRRHRRRRQGGNNEVKEGQDQPTAAAEEGVQKTIQQEPTPPSLPSMINRLIPPPPQLISDKYAKEKSEAAAKAQEETPPPPVEAEAEDKEKGKKGRRKKNSGSDVDAEEEHKETEGGQENWEIQRVAAASAEEANATAFSTVKEPSKFSLFGKFW